MNFQNDLLKLINVSKSYVSETETVAPLKDINMDIYDCLLYTSPSPRDRG